MRWSCSRSFPMKSYSDAVFLKAEDSVCLFQKCGGMPPSTLNRSKVAHLPWRQDRLWFFPQVQYPVQIVSVGWVGDHMPVAVEVLRHRTFLNSPLIFFWGFFYFGARLETLRWLSRLSLDFLHFSLAFLLLFRLLFCIATKVPPEDSKNIKFFG